ncbi:MAG: cbb3-type cytochrome c oxidase subunit 3 [Thiomargarita sp.]|nr:cbb3-type cytochrome c oxidase subunit 3 [Thiomargarita sp.]
MNILILFQSIWTIVVLVLFLGIVIWTFSSRRKFDSAANAPINDDDSIKPIKQEQAHV